ncbi:MAG: DUF5640 domain-containing protein [Bacteroidota bacterium]
MRVVSLLLALAFVASPAAAQSLVGTWYEAATGLTYAFSDDGTGQLVQPGVGAQPFAYALDGATLTVQQNGGTVAFSVQELTASRATFALANGATFTLTREGTASTSSGVTEADVMVAVRLAEFVVGEALGTREIDGIRREVLADHASDPAGTAESLGMFRTVLNAAAQATDPVAVGVARQQLLVALLDMRRQMPGEDSPFFDAITNRVRLVAFDPASGTGATDRDVRAAAEFVAWQAQMAGSASPAASYAEYETYVAQNFAGLSQDEKEFLSAASVIWPLVQAQWAALSAQQQQQAQTQIAGQSADDLLALQEQTQQSDAYYRAMSQISAMQHQTSMSILNNMGGGSDYEMWSTDAYGNPTYQIY